MDKFMSENLEDYLSGALRGERKRQWDAYLATNPKWAREMSLYEDTASLLQELRAPEAADLEPAPGFYARVMERVEEARKTPFWMVFLEPAFVRQFVLASLVWFALLGAYTISFDSVEVNPHIADSFLTEEPAPEYSVRLGTDLNQNRDSMLTSLMVSAD